MALADDGLDSAAVPLTADPLLGVDGTSGAASADAESGGPRRKRRAQPTPLSPAPVAAPVASPVASPAAPAPTGTPASYLAGQRDPARWAKVLDLSKRLGLPDASFVDRNFDALSQADQRSQSATDAASVSPTLATWLADADNATLAKHETPALARVDRGATLLAQPAPGARDEGGFFSDVGTASATGAADLGSATGHLAVALGLMKPHEAAAFVADMNQRAAFLRAQAPDYATEFAQTMQQHAGAVDKAVAAMQDGQAALRRSGILNALMQFTAAFTKGLPAPTHVPDANTLGETLGLIGAAAARPRGLAYSGVESMAGMAPMLAAAAAGGASGAALGSVVPGVGTAVGGTVGGMVGTAAGMLPGNLGAEINGELTARGVDITDPAALERAFSDPALMHAIRAKATKAGVTNAAVVGLMSGFAGKLLAGAEGGSLASKAAAAAGDVSVQAAGMGAAQVAGQVAKGEKPSAGAALSTAIQMLGVSAGMEAIGASRRAAFHADPVEAAAQATSAADRALRAARDGQVLDEIGQAVKEAPTTASVPDRIRSLVETATGGREAASVFFQPEDWDRHWTAQGASPAQAAADILGDQGKAYAAAKATGSHLEIPLGDYIAHVAPTDHWDGLLQAARTTPDGPTLAEAHEYLQSLPATMREIATEATAAAPARTPDSATEVGAGVEAQLLRAGVGPVAAKAQASLYESTFRAMGERLGQDPKALFDAFNVEIARRTSAETADGATLEQSAFHGSPHVFDKFSLDKIGTGEGAQAYGHGLYFAGKKEIAQWYRDALSKRVTVDGRVIGIGDSGDHAEMHAENVLVTAGGDIDRAIRETDERIASKKYAYRRELLNKARTILQDWKDRGAVNVDSGGRLYHVEIPDDDTMIHWDKPFSEQPEKVKAALEPLREQYRRTEGVQGPYIADSATGEEIYRELRSEHVKRLAGGPGAALAADPRQFKSSAEEAASRQLASLGINGIKYLDGNSRGAGEGSHNYVVFDDRHVAIKAYEQAAGEGARGRIVFGQRGVNIDLLEKADRSTFLHETGHFYLHVLDTVASEASAPDDLKADRATIRTWLGADSEAPFTREQHEQFARGFEAYLMEGKAPSVALRGVFQRFATWLAGVYGQLSALKVTLTPEVRAVMDRLVASREAIAHAETAESVAPLFADPRSVGMTEAQATRYEQAARDAHESAEEALTTAMMQSLRREESKEWADWRAPIEKEVAAQVANSKVSRALVELSASFKIDRAAAKEMLGPDAVRQLPRGVTATEGGVHPDAAADLLGFASGRDLLAQLAHTPPDKVLIKHLTDQRMQAEHGDRMTDAAVAAKASEVVHGEKRARLLRLELEHLASQDPAAFKGLVRAVAKVVPPTAAVKAHARELVGATLVRDLRPDRFEQAAARQATAAREALLKGDLEGAMAAKRQELLATEVFNEATRAKAETQQALDTFKKVFRKDERIAPTRDLDLVNAARSVLASFGIGASDQPAEHYLAQVRRYDPESAETMQALVDQATSAAGGAKDYRDLALDEFRTLADAVRGLWNLARSTRQITVDGVKMDRLAVQAELVARVHAISDPSAVPPGTHEALTALDRGTKALLSFRSAATKAEHWVRLMDGGASDGPFRRLIFNRIREATDLFRVRKGEELTAYAEALQARRAEGFPVSDAKIPAPELDYTFAGHNELLGALLHRGNDSNLTKNLVGRGWATVREDGSVDTSRWDAFEARMRTDGTLVKAHYDWAQDVWDRLEALKPDAQAAHRAMYGRYFAEITATPFVNEHGSYRGGYYPARADAAIVPDAQVRADRDKLLGENTSFMFPPSVGKGFTVSRVEGYRKPLVMDAAAVPEHMDAVLRFTHLGPAVREVGRVVLSAELRDALQAHNPTTVTDLLVPWLERAGQQRSEAMVEGHGVWRGLNTAAGVLRRNTALQLMAANSTVLLEQLTHLPAVLVRLPVADIAGGLWKYTTNHAEVAQAIAEASPFMRTREGGIIDDARGSINKILLDPSTFATVREFAQVHGRFLMAAVQSVMDHSVWTATYDRAMQAMPHEEAVRHADATVRELMGSYAPEDVSAIEASTPVARLFNMFAGFFLTKANVLGAEVGIAKQLGYGKSKARLASAATFGFLVPAMLGLGVKNVMAGKGVLAAGDDEGALHALLAFAGQASLDMTARMIPFGGSALLALERSFHAGRTEDLLNSPAIKMAGDALAAPGHLAQGLSAGAVTSKEITDIFSLLGLATGLPLRPVGRAVGFAHDAHAGRAAPSNPLEYARGLATGHMIVH